MCLIFFSYHKRCYRDFVNDRIIKYAHNQYDHTSPDKEPFNFILRSIKSEEDRIWNSSELHKEYLKKGGTESKVCRLIERLEEQMKDEIYCFKTAGMPTVIMHKQKATSMFKVLVKNDTDEDEGIKRVAKRISSETKETPVIKDTYPTLDEEEISDLCLPSLLSMLCIVSPKFRSNLKVVALMSSMIKTVMTSKVSMLQVALGLEVQEKRLIDHLYEYRVTASYEEVRRFRISAAFLASQSSSLQLKSTGGLIQGSSDNFDAHLCTQNDLQQTRSLASIICQPSSSDDDKIKREHIPRLKKQQLTKIQLSDIEMKIFAGEKKPKMPASLAKFGVLPLKVLCHQIGIERRAAEEDFLFLKSSVISRITPDFSGYNTRGTRETGQSVKSKSKVYYRPMINKTLPTHLQC